MDFDVRGNSMKRRRAQKLNVRNTRETKETKEERARQKTNDKITGWKRGKKMEETKQPKRQKKIIKKTKN